MRDYSVNRHYKQRQQPAAGGYPLIILLLRALLRFWRFYIAIIIVAAGLLGLKYLGLAAFNVAAGITIFPLEKIEVSTTKLADEAAIKNAAGLNVGDGIALVSLANIRRAVEAQPWIRSASVHRILPDRLQVQVVERNPVAVVSLNHLNYLDDNGDLFRVPDPGAVWDLPIITGVSEEDVSRSPLEARERLLLASQFLARVGDKMPKAFAAISEVGIARDGSFTLYTADGGVPLRLGAGPFDVKLADLALVYDRVKTHLPVLAYIDISIPGRVIVGYRQPIVANNKKI